MKNLKIFTMLAAVLALGLTSCSKDNEGTPPVGDTATVEVSVGGVVTKADQAAVGGELTLTDNDWVVYAQTEANGDLKKYTPTSNKAQIQKVKTGSTLYVIGNIKDQGLTLPATASEATIQAISTSATQTKSMITAYSAALKNSQTNPVFTTPMLMSGTATVSAVGAVNGKVQITINLKREYAKITAHINKMLGSKMTGGSNNLVLNGIQEINIRQIAKQIAPFKTQTSNWYVDKSGTYTPGTSDNVLTNTTFNSTALTGYETIFGYASPNYGGDGYTTMITVGAKLTGKYDGLTLNNEVRWFRILVHNGDYMTAKGKSYTVKGTLNGLGEGTELEVITKGKVDVDANVVVDPWDGVEITGDME